MNDRVNGQIIKIISDNFYVSISNEVVLCKCRGKFKKQKQIPLVGDFVFVDPEKRIIEEIGTRQNEIIRPRVANITQAIVVTSLKDPDFSTNLLDKLLVQLEINHIKPVICITKSDVVSKEELNNYKKTLDYYEKIGYLVIYNTSLLKLKKVLNKEITVFLGQTGAGKSTLLNKLFKELNRETGEISKALGRGKHTTRHAEILKIGDIQVLDTPGFSDLVLISSNISKEKIREAFKEFKNFPCEYPDCSHIKEKECEVKKAVNSYKILKSRYENYQSFIEEYQNGKRW